MTTPDRPSKSATNEKRHWSDLAPRLISAGVLLAITIFAVAMGGIWFAFLLAVVFAGMYREWEIMVSVASLRTRGFILIGAAALIPLGAVIFTYWIAVAICLLGVLVAATGKRSLILWRAGGLIFFTAVIIALVAIRGDSFLGFAACFFLGASVWMTDTGAFFSGRLIGGAKLNREISPSKTWSGALGGLVAGTLSGVLVWVIVTPSPWWIGALLAAVISISGQFGDLGESAVKRHFRIKDTGDLIPGHGGLLDRIDSLTFAALAALIIGALHLDITLVAEGLLFW